MMLKEPVSDSVGDCHAIIAIFRNWSEQVLNALPRRHWQHSSARLHHKFVRI